MRSALRAMPAAVLVFTAITAAAQSAAPARAQTPVPLTGRLYVTSWFGGVISVVDLTSGQLRQTIPAGVQNHNVYLAPDRKTACPL